MDAPGGELLYRRVAERFTFYVGEYATVTASGAPGCGAGCIPLASTVEVDAHVVFAGTRIASAKPSRTLYYYRTRLGTVVATSLSGGVPGAGYRYTPYGEVELSVNETEATRSELGYTNALRLTGSLLYLKSRVYDAEARVFIQPDTVDRLRYAYVWGDPVNLSDPTGLLPLADFLNSMNPIQRVLAGAAVWWSRDGSFTDAQVTTQTSEEQTKKENQLNSGVALQNEPQAAEQETDAGQFRPRGQQTITDGKGNTVNVYPAIECHGVSAAGFSGDVNGFRGATPGLGPNAFQGYETLSEAAAFAVLTFGPGVAGAAARLVGVAAGGIAGGAGGASTEAALAEQAFWGRAETLGDHFARHGASVGATTAEGYAQQASSLFVRSQVEGLPTKIDAAGIIRVYDPGRNLFGAFNPNGTARTLFSPTRGAAYFAAQPGVPPWVP